MPKQTIRTCIGTNEEFEKSELLRFVKGPDGNVWLDLTGKAPGRGAHLQPTKAALNAALKRKAFKRALDADVPNDLKDQVIAGVKKQTLQSLGLAKKASILVLGLEKAEEKLKSYKAETVILADDAGTDAKKKANNWQRHNICVLSGLNKDELSEILGMPNCAVVAIKREDAPVIALLKRLNSLTD